VNHSNDERTVRCPVEGCGKEVLARGLHLHVLKSDGGGHGARNEVPDDLDLDAAKDVGEEEVVMDYPEERETEDAARFCPYCNQTFEGLNGLMIHLGQKAGRDNHPVNPKDRHEPGDFPPVEVDANGNIRQSADDDGVPDDDQLETGAVPVRRVLSLVADLMADREPLMAHRVRKELLDINNSDRPIRRDFAHPDVYRALSEYASGIRTDVDLSATLSNDGILVEIGEVSALYSADEALDLAASLDDSAERRGWAEGGTGDLIEFLRDGASTLRESRAGSDLHEELADWKS
jgi:hypothetical protein